MINKSKLLNSVYFTEENLLSIEKDLKDILVWQEKLRSINTEGVQPLFTTTEFVKKFLSFEDNISNKKEFESVLLNATLKDNDYFLVPKVINK